MKDGPKSQKIQLANSLNELILVTKAAQLILTCTQI